MLCMSFMSDLAQERPFLGVFGVLVLHDHAAGDVDEEDDALAGERNAGEALLGFRFERIELAVDIDELVLELIALRGQRGDLPLGVGEVLGAAGDRFGQLFLGRGQFGDSWRARSRSCSRILSCKSASFNFAWASLLSTTMVSSSFCSLRAFSSESVNAIACSFAFLSAAGNLDQKIGIDLVGPREIGRCFLLLGKQLRQVGFELFELLRAEAQRALRFVPIFLRGRQRLRELLMFLLPGRDFRLQLQDIAGCGQQFLLGLLELHAGADGGIGLL